METQIERCKLFRELHVKEDPLILYNIWDLASAQCIEEAGASAIATSSWSVAASHGYEDGEKLYIMRWVDGKQDGVEETWYDNGMKEYIKRFRDGNQDGIQESWYYNGQKHYIIEFRDGKPDRVLERYIIKNDNTKELIFMNDERIAELKKQRIFTKYIKEFKKIPKEIQ